MTKVNWDDVIDNFQAALVWFLVILVAVCIATLILFDVFVGASTMDYLTNGNTSAAFAISLATTGLLMSLMYMTYSFSKDGMTKGILFASFALVVYVMDVGFDSYAADVLGYGRIVTLAEVPIDYVQIAFRVLMGGLSSVGEGTAIAMLIGMPVLKEIINKALPVSRRVLPSGNRNSFNVHSAGYNVDNPFMSKLPRRDNEKVL